MHFSNLDASKRIQDLRVNQALEEQEARALLEQAAALNHQRRSVTVAHRFRRRLAQLLTRSGEWLDQATRLPASQPKV